MSHIWHNTIRVIKTNEFEKWLFTLPIKKQALIEARIYRIENHGHFGDAKYLGNGLSELRWKSGIRIYFVRIENGVILLLLGGEKNAQKKDIERARILLKEYAYV